MRLEQRLSQQNNRQYTALLLAALSANYHSGSMHDNTLYAKLLAIPAQPQNTCLTHSHMQTLPSRDTGRYIQDVP
jgi:hypothetical protein